MKLGVEETAAGDVGKRASSVIEVDFHKNEVFPGGTPGGQRRSDLDLTRPPLPKPCKTIEFISFLKH